MLFSVLRITVIISGNLLEVQNNQSTYKEEIARLRRTIYDCNMVRLTNVNEKKIAAVMPTPKGVIAITSMLEGKQLDDALNKLKNNRVAICEVKENIISEGIITTNIYDRYDDESNACHIIGYIDDTGHGVSGLELAYDDFLFTDKKISAVYSTNGKGYALKGIEPYFENDLSVINSGLVTTLDINIQNIVENAAAKMTSGCVIVAEVPNGKIRAIASVPTFDLNNIYESLNKDNSPMINRSISAFNIGSAFKPCVAIAAIESEMVYNNFICEGFFEVGDRLFKCHELTGHGLMNLQTSLAQSCNCYFYNCALSMGGSKIYNIASKLSISSKLKIADNLYVVPGNIPTLDSLTNKGLLANFSIGQGDLMASPVAILNLYLAIASDGSYIIPSVVEKTIKDGTESYHDTGRPTRVMKNKTAEILRQYLKTVITEGTGGDALPKNVTAAGKTATAQTGRRYNDGTEITNSWFCGFFPAENPKYVAIVMSDNKLNISTGSIFAQIADEVYEYSNFYSQQTQNYG